MPGPLAGLKILDFSTLLPGPFATMWLADLGADVVRVENPSRPDVVRFLPPFDGDVSAWHATLHRSKRSLTLDLKQPGAAGIVQRLVQTYDILLEQFRPGVMARLGLGYEALRDANPRLIYVALTGYGQSGPYRDRGAYGPGVDAMSGLSHLTGYDDGPPIKPGNFFCDQNAAVLTAISALSALRHRERTGEGQQVELAMIEGEFQILADAYMDYWLNGRERRRSGNDHPWMAPHDTFPCRGEDAWVAIAVESDAQFTALCACIGRRDLAMDGRFATLRERNANRRLLDEPISAWTRSMTPMEAQEALQAAGVPAAAVMNAVDLLRDQHVVERRGFQYVEMAGSGPTPYPRPAFVLERTPIPLTKPPSRFGDANDAVLRGLLGLSAERVQALYDAGITADEPVAGAH